MKNKLLGKSNFVSLMLFLVFLPGLNKLGNLTFASNNVKEKIKTILLYQRSYFQKIHKLSYEGIYTFEEKKSKITQQVKFALEDGKYNREVVLIEPATGDRVIMRNAYDGEKYQFFLKRGTQDKGILIVSSNPLPREDTSTYDIFLSLYSFAFSMEEAPYLSKLRDEKRWEKIVDMASGLEETMYDKLKVLKINFKRPGEKIGEGDFAYYVERSFEVFFASDYNYLPVNVKIETIATPIKAKQSSRSTVVEEVKVTEVKSFDDVYFPLKIEFVTKSEVGKQEGRATLEIAISSLKINKQIDKGDFTIPRSGVGMIIDEDTGEVLRQ